MNLERWPQRIRLVVADLDFLGWPADGSCEGAAETIHVAGTWPADVDVWTAQLIRRDRARVSP